MKWFQYRFKPDFINAKEIWLNEDNIMPRHFEHYIPFTEYWIKRNSDTCFITVGDSWSYGHSLKDQIRCGISYNFELQLQYTYSSVLANEQNIDLLIFACPASCNLIGIHSLERLVNFASSKYKNLIINFCMTEPFRETNSLSLSSDQPTYILSQTDIGMHCQTKNITLLQWLEQYDSLYFSWFDKIITQARKTCNVQAILSRNLTKHNAVNNFTTFKLVPNTWYETLMLADGNNFHSPNVWLPTFDMLKSLSLSYDNDWLEDQIRKQKSCLDYSQYKFQNTNLQGHPNVKGHEVWKNYILENLK
jgi:hypothetical protein